MTAERRHSIWIALGGAAIAVLLVMARRSDQIVDPQVWVEDGSQILPSFIERGVRAFFTPVNGYFNLTGKLLCFVSLKLLGLQRLQHLPALSTALALAATAIFLTWVASTPLIIPGGPLLAIAAVLVPTDTEVFALPSYTFWFAGLALSPLLLWKPADRSWVAGRVAMALVGGLSNPLVILFAPIAAARMIALRAWHELWPTLALIATGSLQLWVVRHSPGAMASHLPPPGMLVYVFARFLAWPLTLGFANEEPQWITYAVAAVHAVAICALLVPAESRARRAALVGLFGVSALSSILRCQPPTLMHPAWAGPRYFFYPDVCLLWLWLDALLTAPGLVPKLAPAAVLALTLHSTSSVFDRHHAHLDWAAAARKFAATGSASFPVEYDGSVERQWTLQLAPCGATYCKVN
jgi:hypothetical protein